MLADPRRTGAIGELVRCACGLLGCVAMVGATSFGLAVPANAESHPHPPRSIPPECRTALRTGDRQAWWECREAWRAMREKHHRAYLERHFKKRPPKKANRIPPPPASPKTAKRTPPRPVVPLSPVPTPLPPSPTPTQTLVRESAETTSLQPLLLLGLLLPAAAAIGYPLRRRLLAVGNSSFFVPTPSPADPGTGFTYRPTIDPFALPVLGLTGPGAAASARVLTLIALEECGETTLVIIPRPDSTALFGLSEDELLDETGTALFIPGNLDSALAYLETELAIRRNTGGSQGRRLLLVADCGTNTDQINEIHERHPGEFAAILLGDWPGETATVDEDGLVNASPALGDSLPERLPAMSRTEARDRLNAALRRHRSMNTSLVRKSSRKRR
ncbi:hypothetical protein Acsp03_55000 [Actinomadura sp. NBRC 104412]|uniref:hypothetical protein n=1 Tax=Actinomadura sp. NBRC 104412 TaxID=3032203 RepID=UPI0024A30BDE|nr:hypothetical protein [Actinomadura sp. NBRC 104412]GLZ08034.1 hypothetical protein Acsp03_55000 [Actinomadura sp. NBRC 104412]